MYEKVKILVAEKSPEFSKEQVCYYFFLVSMLLFHLWVLCCQFVIIFLARCFFLFCGLGCAPRRALGFCLVVSLGILKPAAGIVLISGSYRVHRQKIMLLVLFCLFLFCPDERAYRSRLSQVDYLAVWLLTPCRCRQLHQHGEHLP